MIGKFSSRNPLDIIERRRVKEAIDLNMSYREMSEYVGRPKATVMREAKRFGHYSLYNAEKAQGVFESNMLNKNKNRKKKDES